MNVLVASILLIVLVILSNIISHYIVSIPTALIEIAVGLFVALLFDIKIDLEADWFMLLFVAPLLFNDGKLFPKNELWELRTPIFANAIILVLLTTVLGGYFIHFLIPDVSLPLAMALVAVLSPTDPVAVHGIAERVKLPKKILSLISGESLINDASGLIAFKYALAAFMTGQFSMAHATVDFLYKSVVGALIGFALMSLIHFLRIFLVQQGIVDVVLHTTIQILTPFVIFIIADEVANTSGVIAVVAAGVLSINQTPIFKSGFSEIRLVTNKMWDILVYLLNGVVFVILGVQLPTAMSETLADPEINNLILIGYILAIWIMLLVVRIVWSYIYMCISYARKTTDTKPSLFTSLLTGLTGVRGAVTMATIMSMPFLMPNGELFEQRPLITFLACGVVLTSLLVATAVLPILTKQKKRLVLVGDDSLANAELSGNVFDTNENPTLTEIEARKIMIKNAILVLKEEHNIQDKIVLADLLNEFETRLRYLYREQNDEQTNKLYYKLEKRVQEIAIAGEKEGVRTLLETDQISPRMAKNYLKLIDYKKQALVGGLRSSLKRTIANAQKQINHLMLRFSVQQADDAQLGESTLLLLEKASTKSAIASLRDYKKNMNPEENYIALHIVNQLLHEYLNKLQRINQIGHHSRKEYQHILQEYSLKAFDAERATIQELYEHGQITLTLANNLRQSVNYYESSLLQRK